VRRIALVLAAFGAFVLVAVLIIDASSGRAGDSVVLIGDSITDWNEGPLTDALGETYALAIRAKAGAETAELMPDAVAVALAGKPDQVVINLGTNDMASGRSASDTIADIEAMVRLFPTAECVHVVTINPKMRTLENRADVQRVEELNEAIRSLPKRFDNVDIVPWDEIIDSDWDDHPPVGTLTEDTIHPTNPAGRTRLVELYSETLDGCGGLLGL
jgi:lysophospholipase L1-like esterase